MAGRKNSIRLMDIKLILVWNLQCLGRLQHKLAAIKTLQTRKVSREANQEINIMHLKIVTKSLRHARTHHQNQSRIKVNLLTPERIANSHIKRVTLKRRRRLPREMLLHQRALVTHLEAVTVHRLSLQIPHSQGNITTEEILQRSNILPRKRHQQLPKFRKIN